MTRSTEISKMSLGEVTQNFSDEQKQYYTLIKEGRKNPILFTNKILDLHLHNGQKLWLWMTTKTQPDKAFELGKQMGKWSDREEFDALRINNNFLKNILVPSNRWGKLQNINEPILTPSGWKKMGKMKIGDKVFSQDGTVTDVAGVYPQGKKKNYKFIFNDGSWTESGEEHLWSFISPSNRFNKNFNENGKEYPNRTYKKFQVSTTREIINQWGMNPKPHNRIEIPVVEPIQFPTKMVSVDPYLLGLLLGDGYMVDRSIIMFSTVDKELLKAVGRYQRSKSRSCDYFLYGLAADCLEQMDLIGKHSWEKYIPKNYLWNDVKTRIAILRGLMDTDGNIETNGKIEYSTTSKQLAKDVKFLVQSLGGQARISSRITSYTYKNEKKKGRVSYRIRIKIKINPFRLERKAKRFYITKNSYNRILVRVEDVGMKESQCIEVSHPSHLYITREFIVTHNTFVTSIKHLWYNFYKIGVKGSPKQVADVRCGTLNLSPHSNQCQAAFEYILDILGSKILYTLDGKSYVNKCKIGWFYKSHSVQKRQVHFDNDTNFRTAPTGADQASSLAGTRYTYISYDECAQSLNLKEELPAKIMSRLIDFGGPLDLVSTPEVDRPSHQYFFHIAKLGLKASDGWWTMIGKISDNSFLNTVEVGRIVGSIKTTDPAKYRQVKYGEFVTTGKKMFDSLVIERMWDDFNEAAHYPQHGNDYILVADWGFSDTGDPTVFYIIDYTKAPYYRIAYHETIRGGSPFAVLAQAKILQREWNCNKFIHDASSMGGVMIKKILREMNMTNIVDFTSAGGQKADMLFCLITVMTDKREIEHDMEGKIIEKNPDFGRLRSYHISELEEQLGNYQFNPAKGVSDKRIEQDEVMSLGMGIWWLEKKFVKNPIKMMGFNPLASTVKEVFPEVGAKKIGMKIIAIPETKIM